MPIINCEKRIDNSESVQKDVQIDGTLIVSGDDNPLFEVKTPDETYGYISVDSENDIIHLGTMETFESLGKLRLCRRDSLQRFSEIRSFNTNVPANNYIELLSHNGTTTQIRTVFKGFGDGRTELGSNGSKSTFSGPAVLASYTVSAANALGASSYTGAMIFVSDESGGAVAAYSNGTTWKRVTDGADIT
jgi:hypothetical protein